VTTRYGLMMMTMVAMLTLAVACAAPAEAPPEELPSGETEVPSESPENAASSGAGDVVAPAPGAASFYALEPGLSERSTRGHVWAEPVIDGDSLTISLSVAEMDDHVSFEVPAAGRDCVFLGYFSEDEFYARATVCPSCREARIEWGGSLLVCRACGSTCDAGTGEADDGARSYPAGVVPYAVEADAIITSVSDLVEAYERTAAGEATLYEQLEVVEDDDRGDRSWPRCCTR